MNKKYKATALPGAALCGAVVLMSACASNSIAQDPQPCMPSARIVCVNITFIENCPKFVDNKGFVVEKAKFVHWQAVDIEDKPIDMGYEIFFDPFSGKQYKTHGKGRLKSQSFSKSAPPSVSDPSKPVLEIGYKYTIVGDNCRHEPLDPRFKLRR
jgi:hypothetical protein